MGRRKWERGKILRGGYSFGLCEWVDEESIYDKVTIPFVPNKMPQMRSIVTYHITHPPTWSII